MNLINFEVDIFNQSHFCDRKGISQFNTLFANLVTKIALAAGINIPVYEIRGMTRFPKNFASVRLLIRNCKWLCVVSDVLVGCKASFQLSSEDFVSDSILNIGLECGISGSRHLASISELDGEGSSLKHLY